MEKYRGSPLREQDKLDNGLIKIIGDRYIHITDIEYTFLDGSGFYFLPLEGQDELESGLLKYRDRLAERNHYGTWFGRLFTGTKFKEEFNYKSIDGLEFQKAHPFVRIRQIPLATHQS